jgi:hypothetical protein
MPFTPGGPDQGGGYLETVLRQPRDVTLTLVREEWERAVQAYATFHGRHPNSLEDVRKDEYSKSFVPDESKVPPQYSFRYSPVDRKVIVMKKVQVGTSGQDSR